MWWLDLTGRLEQAKGLDPTVEAVTGVVNTVLPRGPVKDALHGRWLGHQLHPMLVALPIGMFSSASLLDILGGEQSRTAARRLVGAGIVAVAPTAAAGLADWSALGAFHKPRRVGLLHASLNVAATLMYGGSWLTRRGGNQGSGRTLALGGLLTLMGSGYLGGHLAYSEGVGMNRNADLQKAPQEWTDAAAASDVGEGELHRVEVDGQQVLLARRGGKAYAIGAVCSHFGGPLEKGTMDGDTDPCVVCPWHGSEFRLADGSVVHGPATVPQSGYQVRTVGERLEVRAAR
jgi:nitrite reductase/ring-hydroxylating ferredoxin subunit/uncharacterized membrane protein